MKRLTENHNLYKKFLELCLKADELGIVIQGQNITVSDHAVTAFIMDAENSSEEAGEIPPVFEFKLLLKE